MDPQSHDQSSKPTGAPSAATASRGTPEGAALTSRDLESAVNANIIRYERRAGESVQLSSATAANDVVFIDESTPTPLMPQRQPYVPVGRRRQPGDSDVLYIGPD
jgi:hypothetical protein